MKWRRVLVVTVGVMVLSVGLVLTNSGGGAAVSGSLSQSSLIVRK